MKKLISALIVASIALTGFAAPLAKPAAKPVISAKSAVPSSETLEKELQSLNWPQFSFVVKSVPKLKAKVDAYGSAGWRYVQGRYQTYGWKKSIDKMGAAEKQQLSDLIRKARKKYR